MTYSLDQRLDDLWLTADCWDCPPQQDCQYISFEQHPTEPSLLHFPAHWNIEKYNGSH